MSRRMPMPGVLARRSEGPLLAALAATVLLVGAGGCGEGRATFDQPARASVRSLPSRFFSPSSFWNASAPADAELDPHSGELVAGLAATIAEEERGGSGPWINTTAYSVPIYTVPGGQRTVTVHLRAHRPEASLSAAWRAVPLPADPRPATGSDGALAVWQPSSGRLWEFWRFGHDARGWRASWGGAMRGVASLQGVYGPGVWPGAHRWWGVSASSLSLLGGLITLAQLRRGEIDHALAMALPSIRAGVYSSPAQRTDGDSLDPLTLPEGAHLRLDPQLDLNSLHLPPLTLTLARAAQQYGIFVTDRSPVAELYAQDPTPTGSNPYLGANGFFGADSPRPAMDSFPWSSLQVLKLQLHASRGTPPGER